MEIELRSSFDQVAQLYDEVRPHYPEQLFKDMSSLTELTPETRILEIAPGTGIATLVLARQGCPITAIEMGPEMAAVARKKLVNFNNVEIITSTFEGWALTEHEFDLVMCGTAFHWIDQQIRWQKSAAALRPDGFLALFRYDHVAGGDEDFFRQVHDCYRQHMPGVDSYIPLPEIANYHLAHVPELESSGLFCAPEIRTYVKEETYTREQYLKLLSTYSGHITLDPVNRANLFECVSSLIDQKFNGRIRKCYLYELIVARKRRA